MKNTKILAGIIGSMVLIAFLIINKSEANPLFYVRKTTSTASTSVVYMTPGTATTTLTLDAYSAGNTTGVFNAALALQFTASTSAGVIDHQVEYSMDGIDWFDEDLTPSSVLMSQTRIDHASTTVTHRWGAGSSTASTTRKVFMYQMPTRYMRVTLSIPIGAVNGSVYAELVGKKEQ